MTLAIPSGEPCDGTRLIAGDTWTWTYDSASSKIPGGTVSYSLAGPGNPLKWDPAFITTVVGTLNTIKIPASVSADLDGGDYTFARHLTSLDGIDRETEALPNLRILSNPATLEPGEGQPWQVGAIALIQARLTNTSTEGMQMYMVDGRQVMEWPLKDLTALLDRLQRQLNKIRRGYLPRERLVTFNPVGGSFGNLRDLLR